MQKASIILTSGISLILLSACSGTNIDKADKTTNSSSFSSTSEILSTADSSKKDSSKKQFDELSQEIKLVLMADIVDSRVKEYPNLEGLTLYYFVDNSDLYLQITSGAGTGHPIYKLLINDNGMTPTQGVCYLGIKGYEEVDIDNQLVPKETLFKNYTHDKSNFDNSAKKVQKSENLKEIFNEQMIYISNNLQNEKTSDNTPQPSDDEILDYFINNILDDVGVKDSFIKQQAKYGVDENGSQMIRYGGGQGAYTTIDGNRILYTGYSFGGVSEDGTVSKSNLYTAYYDFITGEHGML